MHIPWATGAKYDGDFYNDMLHGQGLLRYENGDQYEGTFFDGQRHGKGRMVWKEGHWYEGDWLRDRRHGEGKFSKVSALVCFLCKVAVERTFENVIIGCETGGMWTVHILKSPLNTGFT